MDAWEALPEEQRRMLESQLREIFDLASQKGTLAIISEATWQCRRQATRQELVEELQR